MNPVTTKNILTALQLALADGNDLAARAIYEVIEERARCTDAINQAKPEMGAMRLVADMEERGAQMADNDWDLMS